MKSPDIGLKSNTKTAMIDLCNARLADALDLSLAVKQAHWNLKGPTFIAVHELLDMLRAASRRPFRHRRRAGRAARRHRAGHHPDRRRSERRCPPTRPTSARSPTTSGALVERYAALAKSVREAIDTADDAGDADTADIFTAFSRDLDKDLWFLKSHLE